MAFTSDDIDRLTGATVRGTDDDKIGSIGQVYVDESGAPTWATVRTGLFGTSESFIPLSAADLHDSDVTVPFTKDVVKDAPRVASDGELDEDETDGLYDYYAGRGANFGGSAASSPETAGSDTSTTGPDVDRGVGRRDGSAVSESYDTSGPTTDDAMTRSEERLDVGTRRVETGRARLRKHVVTEQQTVTVPVTHEEATLVREPITDANVGDATSGPGISEEEHEVVLHGEEVVTSKDTVPVERVRLGTEQRTEQQQVTEDVRKERIDFVDGDGTSTDATR